jgi:hypothetical protein
MLKCELSCNALSFNLRNGKNNRSKSACTECTLKLFKIKQFGRLLSAYAVQSVHAPHSKGVNAARAS